MFAVTELKSQSMKETSNQPRGGLNFGLNGGKFGFWAKSSAVTGADTGHSPTTDSGVVALAWVRLIVTRMRRVMAFRHAARLPTSTVSTVLAPSAFSPVSILAQIPSTPARFAPESLTFT
jgi:hypothetical protein